MASLASILTFNIIGNDAGASRAIAKVGAAAEAAGTKSAAAARKSESAWTSGAVAFQKAGKASAIATVAFVGYGVHAAAEFQKLTTVYVTAAGEQQKNLKMVQQGVLNIATSTGTAWKDVAAATYIAEKANLRGADALTVVKASAQGAKEENANLTTVVQGVTSVMASYHLKASDAVSITNQLKTASGEAKTTFEDYVGSLSTVLPIASAAHISLADVLGVVSQLTQHGTTAAESTQEVANAIRNLNGGNAVASKEMAQFGISSTEVSQQLGTRGLSGTINFLSESVLKRLGPAGTVLLSTFNSSRQAAADAQTEFAALPPQAQKLADAYRKGGVSLKDYRTGLKALPADQAALVAQFVATENGAKGFQQAIKNGGPAAQTYAQALEKMLGGVNGLNVALQTSGQSSAETAEKIKRISDAAKNSGKDVSGWQKTLGLTSTQLDIMKQRAEAVAINVGSHLLPILSGVLSVLQKHPAILTAVVGGIVALGAAWTAVKIAGIISNVVGLGKALFTLAARYVGAGTAAATAATEMEAASAASALPEGMAATDARTGLAPAAGASVRGAGLSFATKAVISVAAVYVVTGALGLHKQISDIISGQFDKALADSPKWEKKAAGVLGGVLKHLGDNSAFTGDLSGTFLGSAAEVKFGDRVKQIGTIISQLAHGIGADLPDKVAAGIIEKKQNLINGLASGLDAPTAAAMRDLENLALTGGAGVPTNIASAIANHTPIVISKAAAMKFGINTEIMGILKSWGIDITVNSGGAEAAIQRVAAMLAGIAGAAAAAGAAVSSSMAAAADAAASGPGYGSYVSAGAGGGGSFSPGSYGVGHALGGVATRGWSWTGEHGPELVNFGSSSRVLTNRESMAAAGGGKTTVIIQAWDGPSVDSWLNRGGATKIQAAIDRKRGRGGSSL